jgi:hypothetical protein
MCSDLCQGTLWDLVASLVPADAEPPAIGRISQHETLAKTLLLLAMVSAPASFHLLFFPTPDTCYSSGMQCQVVQSVRQVLSGCSARRQKVGVRWGRGLACAGLAGAKFGDC